MIFPTNVPSGAPPTKVVFDSDNPIMLDLPWFATTFIASVAGEVQVPFSQACTLTVWVPSSLELMLATCTFDGSTELDNDTIPFTLCALIETVPAKGFPSLVVTWMAAIAVPAPAESLTLILNPAVGWAVSWVAWDGTTGDCGSGGVESNGRFELPAV